MVLDGHVLKTIHPSSLWELSETEAIPIEALQCHNYSCGALPGRTLSSLQENNILHIHIVLLLTWAMTHGY